MHLGGGNGLNVHDIEPFMAFSQARHCRDDEPHVRESDIASQAKQLANSCSLTGEIESKERAGQLPANAEDSRSTCPVVPQWRRRAFVCEVSARCEAVDKDPVVNQ